MQNSISPSKIRVALITQRYRQMVSRNGQPATLRDFADWLSDALVPLKRRISHQSIKNWSDQRYLPDRTIMKQIAQGALHDQRGDFAQDILAAIEPEHYQPASAIGREILEEQDR